MMYIIIIDPRSIGSEHGSLNTESETTSKKGTQNDQHPGIIRPMEDKILIWRRRYPISREHWMMLDLG